MAATRLIPLHIKKGQSLVRCLSDRIGYSQNPEKNEEMNGRDNYKQKAKIILSFDDARQDQYTAARELLDPLKIPAVFNITSGFVDEKNTGRRYISCNRRIKTADEAKKLCANWSDANQYYVDAARFTD